MAIGITITGATAPQLQQVADAFDEVVRGRPDGMSKPRWAELCVVRFIKSVLKGQINETHKAVIDTEKAQVEANFIEE